MACAGNTPIHISLTLHDAPKEVFDIPATQEGQFPGFRRGIQGLNGLDKGIRLATDSFVWNKEDTILPVHRRLAGAVDGGGELVDIGNGAGGDHLLVGGLWAAVSHGR